MQAILYRLVFIFIVSLLVDFLVGLVLHYSMLFFTSSFVSIFYAEECLRSTYLNQQNNQEEHIFRQYFLSIVNDFNSMFDHRYDSASLNNR